jgi:hypothetical protein
MLFMSGILLMLKQSNILVKLYSFSSVVCQIVFLLRSIHWV